MNQYLIRLGTAVTSGALVASSFIGPVMALNVTVSGNGQNSNNAVTLNNSSTVVVTQDNNATINNDVDVEAETGDNDANGNTGGDVMINTGNASANVSINNSANTNWADVQNCCPSNLNVTVKNNGNATDNDVVVNSNNTAVVTQVNNANITNDTDVKAETGYNDANGNTGGDVMINTGKANATAEIDNRANWNGARVAGSEEGAGLLSISIEGNGQNSTNGVTLNTLASAVVTQTNNARVDNDVDVEAETGYNDANGNTGNGTVMINTGDANASADVDNLANFNWADLDGCGCPFDDEESSLLVSGNGQGSDNDVVLGFLASAVGTQTNQANLTYGDDDDGVVADTGENDTNGNTAGGADPSILTGNATANGSVDNSANWNILNDPEMDFPEFPDGFGSAISMFFSFLALVS